MIRIVTVRDERAEVISEHPNWRLASWHLDKLIGGREQGIGPTDERVAVLKGEDLDKAEMIELYIKVR